MKPDQARELPPSIRKFLTVTPEKRTTKPQPSPLLSRVAAFLPELEAANKKLDESEKIEKVGPAEAGDVEMDVYVDNTLGELVANNTPKSLIEEVKDAEK